MTIVTTAPVGLTDSRILKALAIARGDKLAALSYATGQHDLWRSTPYVEAKLKAGVAAITTTSAAGLAAPSDLNEIVSLERARTLLGRIPGFRRTPLNVRVPTFSADAAAYAIAEGLPKALASFSLATVTVSPRKIVASIVVTQELLQVSTVNAELMLINELTKALSLRLDQAFIDPDTAGSISNGATVISSSGSTLSAIDADLKALIATFTGRDAALDSAVWVMSAKTASYLAMLRSTNGDLAYPNISLRSGGTLAGIPVLISAALAATGSPGESEIVLLNPAEILVADDGQVDVSIARSGER